VDGTSHEVLSDPAFSAQQDGCIRIGNIFDDGPNGAHLRAPPENRDAVDEIVLANVTVDRRTVPCVSSFSLQEPLL